MGHLTAASVHDGPSSVSPAFPPPGRPGAAGDQGGGAAPDYGRETVSLADPIHALVKVVELEAVEAVAVRAALSGAAEEHSLAAGGDETGQGHAHQPDLNAPVQQSLEKVERDPVDDLLLVGRHLEGAELHVPVSYTHLTLPTIL